MERERNEREPITEAFRQSYERLKKTIDLAAAVVGDRAVRDVILPKWKEPGAFGGGKGPGQFIKSIGDECRAADSKLSDSPARSSGNQETEESLDIARGKIHKECTRLISYVREQSLETSLEENKNWKALVDAIENDTDSQ